MLRICAVFVILGIGMMGWAFNDWWIGIASSSEPVPTTARELVDKGPTSNRHVKVTNFTVGDEFMAYGEDLNDFSTKWDRTYLSIQPEGGGYSFVLKSDDINNQILIAVLEAQGEFQGLVIGNGDSLASDVRRKLMGAYRKEDWERIYVVEHNRKPTSTIVFLLKVLAGVGLCAVGGYFLYLGREELE